MEFITLLSALSISAVAAYYSIFGLASIFSAAHIPVIIMGSVLEVGKIVTAVWLHKNWKEIHILMKSYLVSAVIILMLLTSMGIFGFLSRAHSEQSLPSGEVLEKIELLEQRILVQKENIKDYRDQLSLLDEQINKYTELGAVTRGIDARKKQQSDRNLLYSQIEESQQKIQSLRIEKSKYNSEIRRLESEVGPIKYLAQLIYGESTDSTLLEKSVTWVIIVIVIVFDPLAILLVIAATISLDKRRKMKYNSDNSNHIDSAEEMLVKTPSGWKRINKKDTDPKQLDKIKKQ